MSRSQTASHVGRVNAADEVGEEHQRTDELLVATPLAHLQDDPDGRRCRSFDQQETGQQRVRAVQIKNEQNDDSDRWQDQ